MELTAHCLYAISIFLFAFAYSDIKLEESLGREVIDKHIIKSGHSGRRYLHGKAWRKVNLSKSARKRSRRKAAFSAGLDCMDPLSIYFFVEMLSYTPDLQIKRTLKL